MKRLSVALAIVLGLQGVAFAAPAPKSFDSLDEAVDALVGAIRAADRKGLVGILGPKGNSLVWSGDPVADRAAFQRFTTAYDRAHRLEGGGGRVVLHIGDDDFSFPIPLVPDGPRWRWDTDAGDDELLTRRIGQNELAVIQVCLAYVDAQREYYSRGTGLSSTRSDWTAPRESTTVSSGRRGPASGRARSARWLPGRGRPATRFPRVASRSPITATSIGFSSRRGPTRPAEPMTSSSRVT